MEKGIIEKKHDELGMSLAEALLEPTKIYVKPILSLIDKVDIHGIAHITGGGFYENIPRCLPPGLTAKIKMGSWPVLPIFDLIAKTGNIPQHDMYNTFNMGIGMTVVVAKKDADQVLSIMAEMGVKSYCLGEICRGEDGVCLC